MFISISSERLMTSKFNIVNTKIKHDISHTEIGLEVTNIFRANYNFLF